MASLKEGNLHKWFNSSKSKDGKKGWVNVVTGGTCASDEKGEGTPKCVSSSKRASMTKAERRSASRRKKKADPGQQKKTGAAKPTYVSTDKKKMKEETSIDEKCWDGYTQKGMKKKGIRIVPNCVKESDLQLIWEKARKKADKKTIKRWWDDDGDGIGYEKGEVKEHHKKDDNGNTIKQNHSSIPNPLLPLYDFPLIVFLFFIITHILLYQYLHVVDTIVSFLYQTKHMDS